MQGQGVVALRLGQADVQIGVIDHDLFGFFSRLAQVAKHQPQLLEVGAQDGHLLGAEDAGVVQVFQRVAVFR